MNRPVALITGASSGIGRELAKQLGRQGYSVAIMARRGDLLKVLQDELVAESIPALSLICDVCDQAATAAAVQRCEQQLGAIELLIANAGVSADLPVKKFDAIKARQIYEVNVIGLMQSIAAVLPGMLRRQKGHIVGISSLASYISLPRNYVYCASKAAVNTHLDGLRLELRPHGIHVTTVCPGFIKTDMTRGVRQPMPFLMEVDKAVKLIIHAIQSKKSRLNFPWPLYLAVRLLSFLPDTLVGKFSR